MILFKYFKYLILLAISVFLILYISQNTIFKDNFLKLNLFDEEIIELNITQSKEKTLNEIIIPALTTKPNYESTTATEETTTQEIKNTNYSFPPDWNIILSPDNELCGNDPNKMLTFIAFVIIAPHQFDQRQAIRETWANKMISDKFRVFFMVGLSKDDNVNNQLKEESKKNKDILQEDFYDSYRNMTKKVMASFKWISANCKNSYFTLKIDSDIVVNTKKFIEYLDSLVLNNQHTNKLIGYVFLRAKPKRDPENPWYVSYDDFPDPVYPDFCSGVAYILSNGQTKTFFEYSLNFYKPKFSEYIEDVYIGMIAKLLNTDIINIGGNYFPDDHYSFMEIQQKEDELKLRKDQTYFVTEKESMETIWKVFANEQK